ncbi:unnamed protein product [Bursaphelenchus xylophilus]|uniref:(pine wood nematode) hypothetical protein n=1 Tax=Bursaphelenchus xylophilus TaxID=6326 RepID=A0A7I8WGB7_BURXY|nr:unnamed protein product [Bursaphelenchus xylophilus]CAG9111390.1 unnamed protein product [Bursaphelenchus xylophilus]
MYRYGIKAQSIHSNLILIQLQHRQLACLLTMRSIVIIAVICALSSAHHLDSKKFGKGFEDLLDQNKFENILKGGKIDDLLGNLKNVGDRTKNSLKFASNLHKQLNSTEKKPLNEFFQFIIKHKKEYDNETATSERFQNFRESKRRAEQHQKLDPSATYGTNKFSDLTKEEFIAQKTGIKGIEHVQRLHSTAKPANHSRVKRDTPPSAFDWRDWGIISSIKDQGNCGCCYAFAAVGAVEANHKLYTGDDELDLSEQQMVSCTYQNPNYGNNNGCNGGQSDKVMNYIRDKGITSEASYPYTSGSSGKIPSCKSKSPVIYISDEETLPSGDEDAMADYIYNVGPIVTYLDAHQIMDYTGGIIDAPEPSGGWVITHAVVTVGYGNEGGKDFWVMKNQWGEDYGEAGYFRVRRGVNSLRIADFNYVPII